MENKIFYVCSYGGSGSNMLTKALKQFGNVQHIHSRFPPNKLEYCGKQKSGNAYYEWFNGIPIPDNKLDKYYVIYIYRNPSFAIKSRFTIPNHLTHIQCEPDIKLQDVYDSGIDLYGIREFYDNYTKYNENRNYKIFSVKYEEIFDKQDELCKMLGIDKLNLVNLSTRTKSDTRLDEIYADLIDIMNKNPFIMIN